MNTETASNGDFNCDSDDCRKARRLEEEREDREYQRRTQIERRRLKKANQRLRDALVEHDVAMWAITGKSRVFEERPEYDALAKWKGN